MKNYIRNNNIISFFALTFLLTWLVYLILWLLNIENTHVVSRICLIAAFGCSTSALIVARINGVKTVRTKKQNRNRWLLFGGMLLFSAAVEWLDHIVWNHHVVPALILVDAIIILIPAWIVSSVFSSNSSVEQLMAGIARWKLKYYWYLIPLLLWPVLVFVSNLLSKWMGFTVQAPAQYEPVKLILLAVESFFWYLIFGGSLNEEIGWRGFALNKMQKTMTPLKASIIIGVLWGLWHVPLHLMGFYPYGALGSVIRVFDISSAIVFTWFYNRSNGSLIPVLFLHASRNATSLFLPRHFLVSSLVWTLLAVILVFTDKMWKKREQLHQEDREELKMAS